MRGTQLSAPGRERVRSMHYNARWPTLAQERVLR
jgi:hypothetical protein